MGQNMEKNIVDNIDDKGQMDIVSNDFKDKKKILTNVLLFGAFPFICIVFGLLGKWILFGIALFIYLGIFIYIKLESIWLIITGYYDKKGDLSNALRASFKAYKRKNSDMNTANIFVYMLLKTGKYEKAEEVIKDNTKRQMTENQYIAFYSNYALALWKLNKISKAIEVFDEVLEKFESTSIYVSFGTILTFSDDLNKALEVNKKAYEYNSASKGIKDNLATTYFLLGDRDRAKRLYDELLDDPASFPEAYYNAGRVYQAIGQYDEAIRLYKQALSKTFNGLSAVSRDEVVKRVDYLNRGQGI